MFEKSLDSQLWQACAGGMVQIPPVNSKVYYFPQGHAEHAQSRVDFGARIPSLVLCRVSVVKFLADAETDEVYVRISLVPLRGSEVDVELEMDVVDGVKNENGVEKPASFAKTLTQSDANNGGGFSVPRYCAETIFPPLDYSADPPVQTVVAKDVHGEVWRFRHIYRGTPRRHLLTTGWSTFVNKKKLVAGDSIVFLRSENGELRIGIRRAKRGFGDGLESPVNLVWSSNASPNLITPQGGFSLFYRENENKGTKNGGLGGKGGRVRAEDVLEASSLAANGQPFEVVYYPRASTPEFCVKATAVRKAMRIYWRPGIRFKMAFETEDSSRISWFMGTVDSVHVADPIRWPNSPWRLLQVTWDEPDLLQNVKRVSPWLVEQVTNVSPVQLSSPFSPTRKKLRFDGQFPSFLANPLGASGHFFPSDYNTPTGIQGARHVQIGLSLSTFENNSKLQLEMFPLSLRQFDQHPNVSGSPLSGRETSNNSSPGLSRAWNSDADIDRPPKRHQFLLFGQPILTEQQISLNSPSDTSSSVLTGETIKNSDNSMSADYSSTRLSLSCNLYSSEADCKIFMESEDVGRTLDLSVLSSYEELYTRLANMFGIERSTMLNSNLLYQDAAGAVKRIGDEPFSVFMKTAKRLTMVSRQAGNNSTGRTWITGTRSAENGIAASNKTGPLTMFA